MNIKKILLLAGSALAIMACSVPATASAFTIKDKGKTLENATLSMAGSVKVESLGSGFECAVDAALSVNIDKVSVSEFNITTSTCTSFGVLFKECKIESDQATVPWSATVLETSLEISTATIDITLKNCFTKKFTMTFENLRWNRINWKHDTVKPYVGWEFGPMPKADLDTGSMTVVVSGNLEFAGANPEVETYEIV